MMEDDEGNRHSFWLSRCSFAWRSFAHVLSTLVTKDWDGTGNMVHGLFVQWCLYQLCKGHPVNQFSSRDAHREGHRTTAPRYRCRYQGCDGQREFLAMAV